MIKLHEHQSGKAFLVNPKFITSVRRSQVAYTFGIFMPCVEVEYLGNAGYQTRRDNVRESFEEVEALLCEE